MPVTFQGIRSTTGIMVPQGGTGLSSIASGEILIGNGQDAIATIPIGSEGQVLTVVNGEWTAANNAGGGGGGLSTVNTSGNISGDGSSETPVTLNSNISLTSVTASFNGSGAALTGLTASQIGGLNAAVDARITNIPNAALQNSKITINGEDVSLGGYYNITMPAAFSGVSTSGNISGDGMVVPVVLNDNISLTSVTASFSGSGARLTGIPNSALSNSSITINGSPVALGGSVTVADQSGMTFTGSGFAIGNVVALSGSLVKADYSDDTKSNAFGVVTDVAGTTVTVKTFGEATALSASNYSTAGTLLYVGANGSVTNYAGIPSGKYITQVGILSVNSGKIIIQPRIYGQKN